MLANLDITKKIKDASAKLPPKTKKQLNIQSFIMVFALVVIWVTFGALNIDWDSVSEATSLSDKLHAMFETGFLSARNISNIGRQVAITGITAIGMVYVIIAGEIDLSIGSMIGLLVGIGAILDKMYHVPAIGVILAMLACGALIGTWNGWWIAYRQVPSFIVTLAGMLAFRGLVTRLLGASNVSLDNPFFSEKVSDYYLPISVGIGLIAVISIVMLVNATIQSNKRIKYGLEPQSFFKRYGSTVGIIIAIWLFTFVLNEYKGIGVPLLIMGILAAVFTIIARNTVYGRRVYAMGGNAEATRLSGVNIKRTKLLVYTFNGLLAAFASIIFMSRLGGASPSAGSWQELYTIAACFIGGTSMRGGVGTVFGALTGALIFESLRNGMGFMGIDASWQDVILGSVLLLAVYVDIATRKSSN